MWTSREAASGGWRVSCEATTRGHENLLVYLFCRLINIGYLALKSPGYADPGVIEVGLYDPGAPAGGAAELRETVT